MNIHYTVYKVTNNINGKIYIGTHKTKDVNDNYMGSGKYLKHSIDKHGIENFSKEVMFVFDNHKDMFDKEREIVNEDFIAEENTYNLKIGGEGGWDHINTNPEQKYKIVSNVGKNTKNLLCGKGLMKRLKEKGIYEKYVNKRKEIMSNLKGEDNYFYGKTHTEDTKRKIGKANSKHQSGKGNSQFGTMWITNDKENKKINKHDSIPKGWKRGRK